MDISKYFKSPRQLDHIANYDTEQILKKEYRFSAIGKPTYQNCIELLILLLEEQTSPAVVNNIFNLALSFNFLEKGKRDKKSPFSCNFESQNIANIQRLPKKFDSKAVVKLLAQFNINPKSHPYVFDKFALSNVTEIIKEMSTVCLMIILSCIQDRLSYSKIKKKFKKGIIQTTTFIKRFELSKNYLNQLKPLIANHDFRKGFGVIIIETISIYPKSKKVSVSRQLKFVQLIKNLFYLKHAEILEYMNKVHSFINDHNFMVGHLLFEDSVTKAETDEWFSRLMKCHSTNNQYKKRVIICYQGLVRPYNWPKRLTFSFYSGLIGDRFKFNFKFNESLIDSKYYALGVQLRNYLFLNQVEDHIKLAILMKAIVNHEYLRNVLDQLEDSTGYPNLYREGLNQMDMGFIGANSLRSLIPKVNSQIFLLKSAYEEPDPEKKMRIFIRFIEEQKQFKITLDEGLKEQLMEESTEAPLFVAKVKENFSYSQKRHRLIILNSPTDSSKKPSIVQSVDSAISLTFDSKTSPPTNNRSATKNEEISLETRNVFKENKNIFNYSNKELEIPVVKDEKPNNKADADIFVDQKDERQESDEDLFPDEDNIDVVFDDVELDDMEFDNIKSNDVKSNYVKSIYKAPEMADNDDFDIIFDQFE